MCVVLCYCEGGLKFFFCFLPPRDLSTPHDSHVSKDLITGEIAVAIHLLEKPAKYVIPALHCTGNLESTRGCGCCHAQSRHLHRRRRFWLCIIMRSCCFALPQIVMAWQLGFLRLSASRLYEYITFRAKNEKKKWIE